MTEIKLETIADDIQTNNVVVFDVITLIDEWSSDHDKQWRQYALELIEEIEERLIKWNPYYLLAYVYTLV